MKKIKRYMVDFTASTGGTVLITGRSKKEALRNLKRADHIDDQVQDQLYDMKPCDFDIEFDERSIVQDTDDGTDPFTNFGQDEEE